MLLVRRENTLASALTRRSDLRPGCGEVGGVVSDDVVVSLKTENTNFITESSCLLLYCIGVRYE